MTTFDYTKMATLAETLLSKFGQSMTLVSHADDAPYDPYRGEPSFTETSSTVTGVILPTGTGTLEAFDDTKVAADLVDSKRRFAIIKAKDSTKPKIADTITTADGDRFRVMGVTPVSPGGTAIIYRVGLQSA